MSRVVLSAAAPGVRSAVSDASFGPLEVSPGDDVVGRFLAAVASAGIVDCDAWSPTVVLDATVPNWRFSRHGADAVRAEYARWFAHPGRFEALRRGRLDGGEVIEYTLCWEEDGIPHAAHHMHLLSIVDGSIVADTVMCGGRWPASLLAEMGAVARD